jgi:hypothetical protein
MSVVSSGGPGLRLLPNDGPSGDPGLRLLPNDGPSGGPGLKHYNPKDHKPYIESRLH